MEIRKYDVTKKLCKVAEAGDTLYLSGITAPEQYQTMEEQARYELDAIEALLAQHGSAKGKMVSAVVYLKEIRQVSAFNQIWESWFEGVEPPTRTCVEAKMASPHVQVEITVVAVK